MTTTTRRRLLALFGLAPIAPVAAAASRVRPREPVKLLWTRVNGEAYYALRESLPTLAVGDEVTLRREPENRYDKRAVEVLDADGRKLGYVARVDNPALARMMDAGDCFRATVSRVDLHRQDVRLDIDWLRG